MNLVRDPGVHLAIFVEHAFGTDQTRRVENAARPFRIHLQHRAGLNIDAMLARLLLDALSVLVWDWYRQLLDQLRDCFKHRRRVSELGKHDELHR